MLTLVHVRNVKTSALDTTTLTADYLAFERRRIARRQYLKAFGAMAIIVMLGASMGKVVWAEAEIVSGLLLLPPAALAAIEAVEWYRLERRLNRLREAVQKSSESRKKFISTAGLSAGVRESTR
ncbi:MAG TPA: hypothetical protein VM096_08585 [Vicinamibacterales bacterium]|nr:hypothetical protein [Vicinamibacterales bacterium]